MNGTKKGKEHTSFSRRIERAEECVLRDAFSSSPATPSPIFVPLMIQKFHNAHTRAITEQPT